MDCVTAITYASVADRGNDTHLLNLCRYGRRSRYTRKMRARNSPVLTAASPTQAQQSSKRRERRASGYIVQSMEAELVAMKWSTVATCFRQWRKFVSTTGATASVLAAEEALLIVQQRIITSIIAVCHRRLSIGSFHCAVVGLCYMNWQTTSQRTRTTQHVQPGVGDKS